MMQQLICLALFFLVLALTGGTPIRPNYHLKQKRTSLNSGGFPRPGHQGHIFRRARSGPSLGITLADHSVHNEHYQPLIEDQYHHIPIVSDLPASVMSESRHHTRRGYPVRSYRRRPHVSSHNIARSFPTAAISSHGYNPYLHDIPVRSSIHLPSLPRISRPMSERLSNSDEYVFNNHLDAEHKDNRMRSVPESALRGLSLHHHSKNNKATIEGDDYFSLIQKDTLAKSLGSHSMSLNSELEGDTIEGAHVYFIPPVKNPFSTPPRPIPSDYSSYGKPPNPGEYTRSSTADTITTKSPITESTTPQPEDKRSSSEISAQNSETKNSTSSSTESNDGLSYLNSLFPGLSPLFSSGSPVVSPFAGLNTIGSLGEASILLNQLPQSQGYLNPFTNLNTGGLAGIPGFNNLQSIGTPIGTLLMSEIISNASSYSNNTTRKVNDDNSEDNNDDEALKSLAMSLLDFFPGLGHESVIPFTPNPLRTSIAAGLSFPNLQPFINPLASVPGFSSPPSVINSLLNNPYNVNPLINFNLPLNGLYPINRNPYTINPPISNFPIPGLSQLLGSTVQQTGPTVNPVVNIYLSLLNSAFMGKLPRIPLSTSFGSLDTLQDIGEITGLRLPSPFPNIPTPSDPILSPGFGSVPTPVLGNVPTTGFGSITTPGLGVVPNAGFGAVLPAGFGEIRPPGLGGVSSPGFGTVSGAVPPLGFGGIPSPGFGGVPFPSLGGLPSPGFGAVLPPDLGAVLSSGFGPVRSPGFGAVSQPGFGAIPPTNFGSVHSPVFGPLPFPGFKPVPGFATAPPLGFGRVPNPGFQAVPSPGFAAIPTPPFGVPGFGAGPPPGGFPGFRALPSPEVYPGFAGATLADQNLNAHGEKEASAGYVKRTIPTSETRHLSFRKYFLNNYTY